MHRSASSCNRGRPLSGTDILFLSLLTIRVSADGRRQGRRASQGHPHHLHTVDPTDTLLVLRMDAHAVSAVAPLLPRNIWAYVAYLSTPGRAPESLLEQRLHAARYDLRRGPHSTPVGDLGPDAPSRSSGGERDSDARDTACGAYGSAVVRHLVRRRSVAGELSG